MDQSNSKKMRRFDFSKSKQRHIALKILYFGWDMNGLSAQVDDENTVEYHLFQALIKTCLIESRSTCNYNRCGRTDKGVSSYGQVVSLNVRSAFTNETDPHNLGLFSPDNYAGDQFNSNNDKSKELNYVDMLNRVLPDQVKAIAWAPVNEKFSARFDCNTRSYSYIFPAGNLCLESMKNALNHLVGKHDFRNLCSFDLKNGVTDHSRKIISVNLKPIITLENKLFPERQPSPYDYHQIVIVGQAFLYHQIRCIMTILFLIGDKKESPDVIRDLLDISKCTASPNYNPADPLPLCLFDCQYDEAKLPFNWIYTNESLGNLRKQMRSLWCKYKTKTLMIERVLLDLDSRIGSESDLTTTSKNLVDDKVPWKDFGIRCDNMCETKYISILKRPRDETLEVKLKNLRDKKLAKE